MEITVESQNAQALKRRLRHSVRTRLLERGEPKNPRKMDPPIIK